MTAGSKRVEAVAWSTVSPVWPLTPNRCGGARGYRDGSRCLVAGSVSSRSGLAVAVETTSPMTGFGAGVASVHRW
jgi:hypothetical protein